jgi:hypothetical protein
VGVDAVSTHGRRSPRSRETSNRNMRRSSGVLVAACATLLQVVRAHDIPALSAELEAEIAAMEPTLAEIIATATAGAQKGAAYNKTAEFVDKWGWRLSGTTNLHEATGDLEPMLERWDGMEVRYERSDRQAVSSESADESFHM